MSFLRSRKGMLRRMQQENAKTQRALLDLYRNLGAAVVGPHSAHITSGRYRMYMHVEGLEVFDTLVPLPRDAPA